MTACANYGIEIECVEEHPPLPLGEGSRLPPPPTVRTTFAGGSDEPDPSEVRLSDRALRLIDRVPRAKEGELPSLLTSLRILRDQIEQELILARLTGELKASDIWFSFSQATVTGDIAEKLLVVLLRAVDNAISMTVDRMRDLFIPSFASELM